MLYDRLPSVAIHLLCALLAVLNVATFVVYGVDKRRAIRGEWRVPEATLLALSAAFGALGALLGMYVFHHKTRKPRFAYGVPFMLVVQLAACWVLFLK